MLLWPMPIRGERNFDDPGEEKLEKAYLERLDKLFKDGKYPLYPACDELTVQQAHEEKWFPTYIYRQVAREFGYDPGDYPPDELIYPWKRVTMAVEERIFSLRQQGKWTTINPQTCPPEQLFEWGCLVEMIIKEACEDLGIGLPPGSQGKLGEQ